MNMNRIIGWMIACLLPISVLCATDNAKVCTSFTQQGRQVTFHLTDSAALQLQLCSPSVVKVWFSPDGQLQRKNASFAYSTSIRSSCSVIMPTRGM